MEVRRKDFALRSIYERLHFFGDIDRYTANQSKGTPSLNVLDILEDEFTVPVSIALHKAVTSGKPYLLENARVEIGQNSIDVDVHVKPYRNSGRRMTYYLIMINEKSRTSLKLVTDDQITEPYDRGMASLQRIRDLESELRNVTRGLQVSIEERETANEELQSSNEELLAANEELQSVNEELYNVNSEYQAKIGEVVASKSDLDSLVNALDLGIVFLDSDICVRMFNKSIMDYINFIDADVGRPLHQITYDFEYPNLLGEIADCLMNGAKKEGIEVNSLKGEKLELSLTPTSETQHDGDVVKPKGCILTIKRVSK